MNRSAYLVSNLVVLLPHGVFEICSVRGGEESVSK